MGFFDKEIPKEVYVKAKEIFDAILLTIGEGKTMTSDVLEIRLRLQLATEYDFETAKKVAHQVMHGY